ncbi:MAG: YitT family protein [Clostridia bacterium]|nr:YitT family protein [Clostridia bacterium]
MNENETEEQRLEENLCSETVDPSDVAAEINTTSPAETVADGAVQAVTAAAAPAKKKPKLRQYSFMGLAILLSGVLRAISVHCFIIPNNFAPGGVTGIATMLQKATGWNSGIFMFAINLPLLVGAFFLINKRFAITTFIGILLQSGFLMLLEYWKMPQYADSAILAAIAGGVVGGAGIGLMLKIGGSSGGTDVIATFIYKHFSFTNVSWFIFILDSVVVFVSFFVYNNALTPVLLALVEMFCSAKANETILYGFKTALKFEIITSSPEELSKELMQKLHRGVTAIKAKGMYTGSDKTMLVCIVRRRQVSAFQKILAKYPDTFGYISTTNEVMGRGFISDITS